MMNAGDHRHPFAFQPVDQIDVPERLVAIHQRREEATRQLNQLRLRAGRVELYAKDVMLDVEVRIKLPRRMAEAERVGRYVLPVTRQKVQSGADVFDKLVKRDFALKDADAADVHRRFLLLEIQEGRVQRAEPRVETRLGHNSSLF